MFDELSGLGGRLLDAPAMYRLLSNGSGRLSARLHSRRRPSTFGCLDKWLAFQHAT
ncbi:hypothetical protein MESS2_1190073 [Mesorhizobium metallidurans STM 2683]|uniref:Uncharacterized protein n=1 Tax=Mesorhizobium metallidurans STM 2683 TaxID=1297569 RepID=M5EIZ0_9HYPH|nr:hypothetical protein MESS2_1190073 [Mesorhizobium metallidurans STM 2683]